MARFLQELPVPVVWCAMRQDYGNCSRPRPILVTETDLSAQAVIEIYAKRWGIEPLFHSPKRWWDVAKLWQQSKEALEWGVFPLMNIAPWRKGAMIIAGHFSQRMRMQFSGLYLSHAVDPKSGNFVMNFPGQDQRSQCREAKHRVGRHHFVGQWPLSLIATDDTPTGGARRMSKRRSLINRAGLHTLVKDSPASAVWPAF